MISAASASKRHKKQSSQQPTLTEDATFSLAPGAVAVQTTLSKATDAGGSINAEAERILKSVLAQQAPGLKLQLLPGAPVD